MRPTAYPGGYTPAGAAVEAAQYEVIQRALAVDGCRRLLRAMLAAGQHFWSLPDAITIAERIRMPERVKPGIGA